MSSKLPCIQTNIFSTLVANPRLRQTVKRLEAMAVKSKDKYNTLRNRVNIIRAENNDVKKKLLAARERIVGLEEKVVPKFKYLEAILLLSWD